MKKIIIILLCFISLSLSANTYYVSTTGSDGAAGTIGAPWATWQKAFNTANAGDTVYFRGGTWYPVTALAGGTIISYNPDAGRGHDGTYGNEIVYINYPGEVPILDCSLFSIEGTANRVAISITNVTYAKFIGLSVCNLKQEESLTYINGIDVSACGNLWFERFSVYQVWGAGFFLGGGGGLGYDTLYMTNCDSYMNCDSLPTAGDGRTGGHADGYTISSGGEAADTFRLTVLTGCRSWGNSDDGFDISTSKQLQISNCWSFCNGKLEGDGNGYKLVFSALYTPSKRLMKNCLSAYNTGSGPQEANLYAVGYGIVMTYFNNTSYKDMLGFYSVQSEYDGALVYDTAIYKNNLVYSPTNSGDFAIWGGTLQARFYAGNYALRPLYVNQSYNSFDWYGDYGNCTDNSAYTITDADFVSLDSTQLYGARAGDGSLPLITFLTLAASSDLVDGGVDVGLDYNGAAPDLGYAEYGLTETDSTLKYILSYSFAEQTGVAVIDTAAKTVNIEVEYGTDVTALVATFSLSEGATAAVGATPQVSGTTANNFTSPVTYVVTALDASTQNWTVTVTVEDNPVATVSTTSATYTAVTANVTGRITSANGGTLTARGVCWSTSNTSPTTSDRHTTYSPYVGSFTDVIRGLRGNTTYYVRAYGTTSEGGTAYGDVISFTTKAYNTTTSGGKIGKVNGKIGIVK